MTQHSFKQAVEALLAYYENADPFHVEPNARIARRIRESVGVERLAHPMTPDPTASVLSMIDNALVQNARQIRSLEKKVVELQDENQRLSATLADREAQIAQLQQELHDMTWRWSAAVDDAAAAAKSACIHTAGKACDDRPGS